MAQMPGASRRFDPAAPATARVSSPAARARSDPPRPPRPDYGHRRKQQYALSCEARSAADWAAFFGFAVDEDEFLHRLPASDNPDFGFVGDVNGQWGQTPPSAYGVHAGPVAFLLRRYGMNAHAYKGLTWDHLRAQVAAGRPVIVWVVGHVERGKAVEYTAADGRTTIVARYEHGDRHRIHRRHGHDSRQQQDLRPLSTFLDSWAVLATWHHARTDSFSQS
jgi:hypothetical protein